MPSLPPPRSRGGDPRDRSAWLDNAALPPPQERVVVPDEREDAPEISAAVPTGRDGEVGGVNRCPRCGASEVQLRPNVGLLTCLFCRHEWAGERFDDHNVAGDLSKLRGTTVRSGASEIDTGAELLVTLKCGGCGAEVVVNTAERLSAQCHWCRHVLTIDTQIPNGAVPDAVLPFSITHDEAVAKIGEFARRRRRFANRAFLRDFKPENIVGVYMPYMVIDGNASGDVEGFGERQTRTYMRGTGKHKTTYYDADVYEVRRHVDFTVDDLTLESSSVRADFSTQANTNNIINTILPFDTKNAVKWNANYLNGFTSEKRDQDVVQMLPRLEDQLLSIARSQIETSVNGYDRGVRWERERLDVHGTHWTAMLLPVWLYSHYHEEGGVGMVHYIAVNGRSGEVMGSVPVSYPRLIAASVAVGLIVEVAAVAMWGMS